MLLELTELIGQEQLLMWLPQKAGINFLSPIFLCLDK